MGDDALSGSPLEEIRQRYLAVNGEHPMSAEDEAYAREHFVVAAPEHLPDIAAGRLPLPAYLLDDGTPMVADIAPCLGAAGGVEALHDWFVAFWPEDPALAEQEWRTFLAGHYLTLASPDPLSRRRMLAMVDQARTAAESLRADAGDEVAQGALAEAIEGSVGVSGLDALLRPMTAYDRLRFGGPTPRDLWVDALRAEFHHREPPTLPIQTARLTLRRTVPSDAEAMARAWADPDFARYLLMPEQNPAEVAFHAWQRSQPEEGPHRSLGLVMEYEGTAIGSVMLIFTPGFTSAEIGWTISPEAGGRGLATEAAQEMLRLAFEHYGVRRVVANLDALNAPSAALAERLGMRREVDRRADFWSKGRWTDSYEYALLRAEYLAR